MAADGGNASAQFSALARRFRELGRVLKPPSAKGAEVAPAAADMPKAVSLVRSGRNVFEVDETMQRDALIAFDERADREVKAVMDGRTGSLAAPLMAAAESVRETVRARIDDVLATPGGKAPLKSPRRDGSTDHIGRDTGALHAGLVARLTR